MAITQSGNGGAPSPSKQTLATNYIDFTATATAGWAQQYLPDLMEKEAEVYGNRSLSGFLSQVGAEEAMTSDQVVWSEQGRLHLQYSCLQKGTGGASTIDGLGTHGIRVGDTILVSSVAKNKTVRCYVTHVDGYEGASQIGGAVAVGSGEIVALPYTSATLNAAGLDADNDPLTIFVYGSEFTKGTAGRDEVVAPTFKSYSNKPIIIKDKYEVSGSDASAIGWVEVSGEAGESGFLWYLKAEGETRTRFTDYLEMAMIESEKSANSTLTDANIEGTEGLFAAISSRGITADDALDMDEFDAILAEFDKQGAIEENMMFLDRTESLGVDDMLASQNSYGGAGTSFGVFDNSEDMALNLGFSGFRRGSYDFYKSDWKYLNDQQARGGVAATNTSRTRGVIVPAGVSSVYDQMLGKNLKRPFLHVRYRASQTDDRKMKTWVTGSVGAITSDLDAMEVHYLSERCLVVQGANNFCMLT